MTDAAAAVALIETSDDPPAVLLIRRAERVDDPWSGQWALPGGRRDRADADALATCLREVREEVGLALDHADCSAALPLDVAGRHLGLAISVAPFVFRLATRPALTIDPREVAAIRWCALAWLGDPARHRRGVVMGQPDEPFIDLDGAPLWGLTWRVLCRRIAMGG